MTTALAKAAEALVEATVKEASAEAFGAVKDGVAELRHIHSGTDKLGVQLEAVLKKLNDHTLLDVKLDAVVQKIDAAIAAQKAESRACRIQTAMQLVYSGSFDSFEYYIQGTYNDTRGPSELTKNVLKNALRGLGTWLPDQAIFPDESAKDTNGRPTRTQKAFRTAYSNYLEGLTGIKPTVAASQDGKSYSISL